MSLSADEAEEWRIMSEGDATTKTGGGGTDISIKTWMDEHGLSVSEDTYSKLHENGFSNMLSTINTS